VQAIQSNPTVKSISSTVDTMILALEHMYIDPAIAKEVTTELRNKKEDLIENEGAEEFERAVDEILRSHDKHMFIDYNPKWIKRMEVLKKDTVEAKKREEKIAQMIKEENYGFGKVEKLNGNIGYIKIKGFETGEGAFNKFSEIMNSLEGSESIILDVRESRGGAPEMVQYICSYFFEDSVHLNTIHCRFQNSKTEYWTISVPGNKFVDADLYILTSEITFSAAEELPYNMQNLKRGTVIGEVTFGRACNFFH